jgi:2-dehydropantoate 2-reductase
LASNSLLGEALCSSWGDTDVEAESAFRVLVASGNAEIPANPRMLYLHMPTAFIVRYWRRLWDGPRGELWFAAHSRAAPEEMHALADELQAALRRIGQPTPNLDNLLSPVRPS